MLETESNIISSPEALKALAEVELRIEDIDPQHEEARRYLKTNKHKIIEQIKSNHEVWKRFYDIWIVENQNGGLVYFIEQEGWLIEVCLDFSQGKPHIFLTAFSKEWADRRTHEMEKIFTKDILIGEGKDAYFPVSYLAQKINPQSVSFKVSQQFDPSKITDRLGKGLDSNITELIRLLNMMGLKTTSCCGGHKDHRRPWIRFSGDRLAEVISLMKTWQDAGGLEYGIHPMGSFVSGIDVFPPSHVSLAEAQRDLDRFTDFLRGKISGGDVPLHKLTVPEMCHRIRRKINGLFP